MKRFILIIFLLLCSCSPHWSDSALHQSSPFQGDEEYALVVLVEARKLDYTTPKSFFASMRRGSRDPNLGHAWIVLKGKKEGESWLFEGGHTGELGLSAPRYFDEVRERSRRGEANPAQYLFSPLHDGQLEIGSGGHRPTLAVAFTLTEESFDRVFRLFDEYDFSTWALKGPHCVHFVRSCLAAIGVDCDCQRQLDLPQDFSFDGETIHLWSDPSYAKLTIETPELLEQRLVECVRQEKASLAMRWYFNHCFIF